MTTTIEIKPDYFGPGEGLYIDGERTFSFSVVMERIERYALNLGVDMPDVRRGTPEAYSVMVGLQAALELQFERTGEAAVADLSPQLNGLEGWEVEVTDTAGDEPRTFIVLTRTTDLEPYLPFHAEKTGDGQRRARREYHHVRPIRQAGQ